MWQVVCLVVAAGLEIAIAINVFRRMRGVAAATFALGASLAALWAIDYALDLSSGGFEEKLFFLRVRFLFLPFYPLVWFETTYRFVYGRKFLYGWHLGLASILPTITVILSWVSPSAGFLAFQYNFWLDSSGRLPLLRFSFGPWAAVFFAYCFALILAGFVLLWRGVPRTSWERTSRRLFAAAYLLGCVFNIPFAYSHSPTPGLNYAPILAPITFGLIALALTRGRMLRLAPVARAALIENLEEMLVVLDEAGQVIDLNRAAALALRLTLEKAQGSPAAEVLAAWPEVVARLRQEQPTGGEVHLGGVIHELRILPVADKFNCLQARILILRDITVRKQAEDQMRQAKDLAEAANEAKSRFLTTMTHEIRTPMNGVLGFTDILRSTPVTAEQREYLDLIEQAGRALLAIIEDILEYSEISSRTLELEEAPFGIAELTAHVCNLLLPRAKQKGIELEWGIGVGVPPLIVGDSVRIGRVLTHLIDNAIKFTKRGGVRVDIECLEPKIGAIQPETCTLALRVQDTGIGIAPKAAERIFQPFSQEDNSSTRKYGGTGLGLAIAKHLCELMEGNLRVESRLGQGATFTAVIRVGQASEDRPTATAKNGVI